MMKLLDLERYQDVSPFSLSGGEKKRAALASVLAWNPQYLVLDEPTIGQDALQKERLKNFILQLKTQGKSVIIVTHDIEFVAECHPRVIVISQGKVLADDTAEKILSNEKIVQQGSLVMPQITLLLRALKRYSFSQDVIDIHSAYPLIKQFLSGDYKNVDEYP
jgi:energy-coupling factor transport system ATP-binding protein